MKIKDVKNVKVLYDSVLAKFELPKKEEKKKEGEDQFVKSESGLFIPKTPEAQVEEMNKKEHLLIGEVVAVGCGYVSTMDNGQTIPLRVAEHDYIVIDDRNNANNVTFQLDEEDNFIYRLIREQNILIAIPAGKLEETLDINDSKEISVNAEA